MSEMPALPDPDLWLALAGERFTATNERAIKFMETLSPENRKEFGEILNEITKTTSHIFDGMGMLFKWIAWAKGQM